MRLFLRMFVLEHVCFDHGCFEQQSSRHHVPNEHVTKQTCFKVYNLPPKLPTSCITKQEILWKTLFRVQGSGVQGLWVWVQGFRG